MCVPFSDPATDAPIDQAVAFSLQTSRWDEESGVLEDYFSHSYVAIVLNDIGIKKHWQLQLFLETNGSSYSPKRKPKNCWGSDVVLGQSHVFIPSVIITDVVISTHIQNLVTKLYHTFIDKDFAYLVFLHVEFDLLLLRLGL